jgi:superfamily II DNA or RNA helicase
MEAVFSNKITIKNPTPAMLEYCKALTLPNPDFYKLQNMGKWTGNTPRDIVLYERVGDDLVLPFGCIAGVRARLKGDTPVRLDFAPVRPFNYQSHINLYPYQETAADMAHTQRNGVVVMPCGAGKTQTGLEIVAMVGGRALWLTHTQDLLNQSMARAKSVFGCPAESYGTITEGKVNIGKGLTFATVQTMAKIDLADLKYAFDCVIVDECHKAVGSPTKVMQFYKVLSALSCRYKYGLTATPERSDGLEKSMFALLGGICVEVEKETVAHTTCPVRVQMVQTDYFPSMDIVLASDGTLNYARLVDDMIHDDERFKVVMDIVNDIPHACPTLVLANRVEYLRDMCTNYEKTGLCLSGTGNSKAAKAERKEALRKLNNGELDAVFATYALAREGLDIPNLRYVVFATPEKDKTTVIQAAGRVGRRAEGKDYGTVIDFEDNFGMFRGWAKTRRKYYRQLDYEVSE